MMSQPGLQTIAFQILPNISQNKGNQTMKFGQLIEYNKRNIFFFENYAENEVRGLDPGLILFFEKAYYEVKAIGLQFSFNIFR